MTTLKRTPARMTPVWSSHVGALHGVLTAAGMTQLSVTELMGLSGIAFHTMVEHGLGPGGPTIYDWASEGKAALERIGITSQAVFHFADGGPAYEAGLEQSVVDLKAAIDRGVGAVVWGAGEFGVVYGYDEESRVFLAQGVQQPFPGEEERIPYDQVCRIFPPAPHVFYQIPLAAEPCDRAAAERASLAQYIWEMEEGTRMHGGVFRGLKAYDEWVRFLEQGAYDHFGLRYMTSVYAHARTHAAAYLHMLAESREELRAVATTFDRIATCYKAMMDALGQDFDGAALEQPVTPAQAAAMIPHLREVRAAEAEAVQLVRQVIR